VRQASRTHNVTDTIRHSGGSDGHLLAFTLADKLVRNTHRQTDEGEVVLSFGHAYVRQCVCVCVCGVCRVCTMSVRRLMVPTRPDPTCGGRPASDS